MEVSKKNLNQSALIFEAFGLQYFSVSALTSENQKKYPSLGYTIIFLILFIPMVFLIVFLTFSTLPKGSIKESLNAKTVLNYVIQRSLYIALIGVVCISMITSYILTPLTKKFYLNCLLFSKLCKDDFICHVDHLAIRNITFKYFAVIVLYLFGQESVFFLHGTFFGMPKSLTKTAMGLIPSMFLYTIFLKFIHNVKVVNYHLEIVLELLKELFKPTLIFIENIDFHMKPLKFRKTLILSQKILSIRRAYNIISENAEIINRSLGVTILSIISLLVNLILTTGYNIFLFAVGKLSWESIGGICE